MEVGKNMVNVILSSNLFVKEGSTNVTLKKIEAFLQELNLKKEEAIVSVITNAEPKYGITTVEGLARNNFQRVFEMVLSEHNIEEQCGIIEKSDIVILTGGNPYPLLEALKVTGVLNHLIDDCVLVGVSAGAMVLGKDIELASESCENKYGIPSDAFNYFGDHIIVPHYAEEGYFSKESIQHLNNEKILTIDEDDQTAFII